MENVTSVSNTATAHRLHIALYGRRNSGKSSLINALTRQEVALVSDVAGTTTDLVQKTMELPGIGPCLFIDTPGFDDEGALGIQRIERTQKAIEKTDIALLLCQVDMKEELLWIAQLEKRNIPVILVLNKADILTHAEATIKEIERLSGKRPLLVSAHSGLGIEEIREAIQSKLPADFGDQTILGNLVYPGDLVLLVMPQDMQAPKGRLILPQVQTLRELLDRKCIAISCVTDQLSGTLQALSHPPKLIITDSQVFKTVYEIKPKESLLTSFSVLFAAYKGDIDYYTTSALTLAKLTPSSRVLIAEACTHAPLSEDVGKVKLPRILRQRVGEELKIEFVAGADFPTDLTPYDLVIQCGACMFNRKHVLSRIEQAKEQQVPMTNYGIAIAYLSGILDHVSITRSL